MHNQKKRADPVGPALFSFNIAKVGRPKTYFAACTYPEPTTFADSNFVFGAA